MSSRSILLLLVFLSVASPARSVDGVVEISQACAAGPGCFSGDMPGFPVEIDGSAGRSDRLTSDLVVPNASTAGILVAASHLTIDLNGFQIMGAASAAMYDVSCRPAFPSDFMAPGIARGGGGASGEQFIVRNGGVVGLDGEAGVGYANDVFGNNNGGDAFPQVLNATDLGGNPWEGTPEC